MTGRERSRLQAEEAQDALTMHQLMEAEGQQLLDVMKQLEDDPDFDLPPGLDDRCLAIIRQSFRKPRRFDGRRAALAVFRYVAAAVLVCSLLFITAFATIQEVREGTLKFLVEVSGAYTRYKLVPKEDEPVGNLPTRLSATDTETLLGYYFPAMPEGFALTNEYKTTARASSRYRRDDGAEIYITVTYFRTGDANAHTGDAQVQQVNINGFEGQLIGRSYVLPDGQTVPWSNLLWGNTQEGVLVSIIGYRVEGQVLLELAQQARWVGLQESAASPELMGYTLPQMPEGYWLEAYGKSNTEHYAQYRINPATYVLFRISTKELSLNPYVNSTRKDPAYILPAIVDGRQAEVLHNPRSQRYGDHFVHRDNIVVLVPDQAADGTPLYLWIEGSQVSEETLLRLAAQLCREND